MSKLETGPTDDEAASAALREMKSDAAKDSTDRPAIAGWLHARRWRVAMGSLGARIGAPTSAIWRWQRRLFVFSLAAMTPPGVIVTRHSPPGREGFLSHCRPKTQLTPATRDATTAGGPSPLRAPRTCGVAGHHHPPTRVFLVGFSERPMRPGYSASSHAPRWGQVSHEASFLCP